MKQFALDLHRFSPHTPLENVTGDRELVQQYAHATLQIHMNPILQHYAYTTIGAATVVEDTDTDDE